MNSLTVNFESLPKRCEICHQSDCFDASRNLCSRCSDEMEAETTDRISLHMRREDVPVIIGTVSGIILGSVSKLFVAQVQLFPVVIGLALVGTILGLIASSGLERFGDGRK